MIRCKKTGGQSVKTAVACDSRNYEQACTLDYCGVFVAFRIRETIISREIAPNQL